MNPVVQESSSRRSRRLSIAFVVVFLLGLLALITFSQRESNTAHGRTQAPLQVSSSSFSAGGAIPRRFTCDGAGISPNLQWTSAPAGTKSFAVVMHDPDATVDFTHWLAYNIEPNIHELAEGASPHTAMPQGFAEGINSFGRFGYGGPCPPAGKPHHYVFQIYALDARLDLPPGAARNQLETAIKQHVIAEGQTVGIYGR